MCCIAGDRKSVFEFAIDTRDDCHLAFVAAPVAMARFEKIFASGLVVFGEVIGIRVPWADEVIKWERKLELVRSRQAERGDLPNQGTPKIVVASLA